MVARIRYFVLGIVVALILTTVAHATTWVFWVGAPNADNPANATTVTWGNYWNGITLLFSTQNVKWQMLESNWVVAVSDTTWVYGANWGSQNYETWVALSSAYALNNYVYQGVLGSYVNVAIGNNYTFGAGYKYFVAIAEYKLSSKTCGQLYFHADVYNSASSTATFYGVYIIANTSWAYVTFLSKTVLPSSWYAPAVPGPNACFSSGYYMYIAIIAVNVSEYTVGTAQVSIGTTSEGVSYTLGIQYSWGPSGATPASGDIVVVPWTSRAKPHILFFVEQPVDTTGSSVVAPFYFVSPVSWFYSGTHRYALQLGGIYGFGKYFVFVYDNDTGYFPQSIISAIGCPSGVYMLPTTVSPSVTKLLSCSSISSPSNGIAIYPTDYAKYSSSPATYNPPVGYMVTFSYKDSTGNTYSLSDYFAIPATVYLYVTTDSYSITTRQVSFPLPTNLTLFSIQPSSELLLSQLKISYGSYNPVGYLFQVPDCVLSNNPYGGATGMYALPNCVAITYGAISIVVWFYLPTTTSFGTLLSLSNNILYPSTRDGPFDALLVVQSNGILSAIDAGVNMQVSTSSALSSGWHMAVFEMWASGTSGTYYLALYLDGQFVGQVSTNKLPYMFGALGPFNYGYIGGGYYYNPVAQWFIFNGTIAWIAIYNAILNASQVQQLYSVGFPNTLFSDKLVVAYLLSNTTYYVYDGVSHFYIKPYYANPVILSQLGISNASLITITPTGQTGWVPFSQWVPVPSQPISYCRLLRVYGLNTVSENSTAVTYQVVVGTNTPMNNFPLDYSLLLRYTYYAGIATETKYTPVYVHAFGYGNIYTVTVTMKKPLSTISVSPSIASVSFPMCNMPPGFVALNQSIITTSTDSQITLLVTFSVSNPPTTPMSFQGIVYLNNTPYYTFNIIMPPGANGTTSLVKIPIKFNAPDKPGVYVGNVTVFGLSAPIELIVEAPPSVNTTNSTSLLSSGTNSTINTPPTPPGSSNSTSTTTSSSSGGSSTSSGVASSLTNLSTLSTVSTYLTNPIVITLVVVIIIMAYVVYKKSSTVTIKL